MDTFLATLREQGYSIFVILGQLPVPSNGEAGHGSGAWYTPAQVGRWPVMHIGALVRVGRRSGLSAR